MKHAGIVLLMMITSATLAGADFVGTLNVHTATDRRKTTGRDNGQPIAVQGVGWYVTTSNPSSPGAQEIEAAGPIYNTEGGSDAGFNAIPLTGLNPSPTPAPVASPSSTAR